VQNAVGKGGVKAIAIARGSKRAPRGAGRSRLLPIKKLLFALMIVLVAVLIWNFTTNFQLRR
jgi:hypothetical protein